jgi:hypothetical protein
VIFRAPTTAIFAHILAFQTRQAAAEHAVLFQTFKVTVQTWKCSRSSFGEKEAAHSHDSRSRWFLRRKPWMRNAAAGHALVFQIFDVSD